MRPIGTREVHVKRRIGIAGSGFTVLLVWLLALGSVALAADKEHVIGTPHDLSGGLVPVCESCHISHGASGDFLWARVSNTGGGAFSGLKALCYGCHDGSVASSGLYVFSTSPSVYSHKVTPLGSGEAPHGDDCDRCHDPHDNSNAKFLALAVDANVCSTCHPRGEHSHPIDIQTDYPLVRSWDPAATPPVVGTRLWNTTGTVAVATGSAYIKCETCHTPHGSLTRELNTMSGTGGALCINCHG